MSEPDPEVALEVTAVANGSAPPEFSAAETVGGKKDAEEKNGREEAKVGSTSDAVEEVKDGGGENGEEENNSAQEVKDAEEGKEGKVGITSDAVEEVKDGGGEKCEEEKNGAKEVKDAEEGIPSEEVKEKTEKDDMKETKEIDGSNGMDVEKKEENNGAKETKVDKETMVVEEANNEEDKYDMEGAKNEDEKDIVNEMKNEEEKVSVEGMKNEEENDVVGEMKNEEDNDSMKEKNNEEQKLDVVEDAAGLVKVEEEGKHKKGTEDVEMTEAKDVKGEEEEKLPTSTAEKDGMEVEKEEDAKEEEGGDDEEVDGRVTKELNKNKGKRGEGDVKKVPKDKKEVEKEKEAGDNKEEKVDKKERKKAKESAHTYSPPTIERPVRERKTVKRLVEVIEEEPNKRVIIEKGQGTPLKDIPNVAYKLARKKPGDLKLLHQTLFGRIGKAADFKHHILQFSGFVWHESDEKQRAKIREKLDKFVKDTLLDLCDLLDISVSKTNSKKEDLIVKLLDFLAAPHATTDVILAEKDQQTPKSRKRKSMDEGSASKSREDTVVKKSENKRTKSEPSNKRKRARDSEDDESEEEENENGFPDKDEELGDYESEKENKSEDASAEEDDYEGSGKGKQKTRAPSKKPSSSRKAKMKDSSSRMVPLETSAKSPKKTPSTGKNPVKRMAIAKNPTETPTSTPSKSDEINDAGEKVFSRKKKKVDSPKKSSTSKPDTKDKSSGMIMIHKNAIPRKKVGKDRPKSETSGQYGPKTAQLRKTICEILTKVDFNTATFTDILKQLAIHYKVDLTPRKSSIKQIIKEELTKLADAAEDNEDEEVAEEEDNPKPTQVKG